jgi:hypothetical protein
MVQHFHKLNMWLWQSSSVTILLFPSHPQRHSPLLTTISVPDWHDRGRHTRLSKNQCLPIQNYIDRQTDRHGEDTKRIYSRQHPLTSSNQTAVTVLNGSVFNRLFNLFNCGSFEDIVHISEYTMSNDRTNNELVRIPKAAVAYLKNRLDIFLVRLKKTIKNFSIPSLRTDSWTRASWIWKRNVDHWTATFGNRGF